jgi:hypothetical protein
MLETKLTTCASLLYQWILARVSSETKLKLDLQDFQAWTAEYREKPYSDRELLDALRQLKELQLIAVSKTEVTLEVNQEQHPNLYAQPPAERLLTESDRPNRSLVLLRIIVGSLILSFASIGFGLGLTMLRPQTLTAPHPWSVLGGDNLNSGK